MVADEQSLNRGKLKVNKPNNRGKENTFTFPDFNPGFLVYTDRLTDKKNRTLYPAFYLVATFFDGFFYILF